MARLLNTAIVLPGLLLLVFAMRALDQERRVARQQLRERVEHAADLAVRAIDQQTQHWREFQNLGVLLSRDTREAKPGDALAYALMPVIPAVATLPDVTTAEVEELRHNNLLRAADAYKRALQTTAPEHKALVLQRLARTWTKIGDRPRAIELYRQMLKFPAAHVGLVPSDLIARFQLCVFRAADCVAVYRDLVSGTWRLPKEQYTFYADALAGYADSANLRERDEAKRRLTAAAERSLSGPPTRVPAPGFIAFWDANSCLIVRDADVKVRLEQLSNIDPECRGALVPVSTGDSGYSPDDLSVQRGLSASSLPWRLVMRPVNLQRLESSVAGRQRMYLSMLLLSFGTLISGAYMNVRMLRREREVARLQSEFVSTVSHEFRSPLTAIRQFSELLMRGRVTNDDRRQQYYGLIASESDRLSRLVENLLDFSRIEDSRKQYHFESVEVVPWLTGTAAAPAYQSVKTSFEADVPAITADRSALTSAVTNLLDNAIKYSPPGRPVVLTAEAVGDTVAIAVADQGHGIADEDKPHIFEKFYRARGDISRQVKGAGLGLCLVKEIVETHGGRVEFDSAAGVGSTFRIYLKAAK